MHLFYAAKLVPVAFGIKKLQISCVIEDEKVVTTLYSLIDSKFLMVIIFKLSRNQKLTWTISFLMHDLLIAEAIEYTLQIGSIHVYK